MNPLFDWRLVARLVPLVLLASVPTPQEHAPLAQPADYFRVIDLDRDGQISVPEARWVLGLTHRGFLRFDGDGDGKVALAEFEAEEPTFLWRLGVIEQPRDTGQELRPDVVEDAPSPAALALESHDRDRDGSLDALELRALARERRALPFLPTIARVVDRDQDGRVTLAELEAVPAETWTQLTPPEPEPVPERERPLLDAERRRPMDPWRRADLDDDGALSPRELVAFAPATLDERALLALLQDLDQNDDERLSLIELEAALGR
ncbi:MAG: hypothetical protein WD226_04325 [Planctomycetota bacterium]